jgi:hypothetical protein
MNRGLKDTFDACQEIDSISNKRNIDPEILKAYINLYSFLHTKICDEAVVPKLSDAEIIENWISNRNWLMIPPKDCINRDQAQKSPYPNIWIYLTEDLEQMRSGLHWAQVNSVDNFLNLLDSLNHEYREQLKEVFKTLKKDYEIVTEKKIHKKGLNPLAPAEFEDVKTWHLKDFDSNVADEILTSVASIREEGQHMKDADLVDWCVPTIDINCKEFAADDYEQLLNVVIDYIKILKVCHKILTQSQMRKIKRNLEKFFDYEKLRKEYDWLKFLLNTNGITKDDFNKRVNEMNQKIIEYNLAFHENLELL